MKQIFFLLCACAIILSSCASIQSSIGAALTVTAQVTAGAGTTNGGVYQNGSSYYGTDLVMANGIAKAEALNAEIAVLEQLKHPPEWNAYLNRWMYWNSYAGKYQ